MMGRFNLSVGSGCYIFPREGREHYSPKDLPNFIFAIIHRGEKLGYYTLPEESLSEEEFREVDHLRADETTINSGEKEYVCIDLKFARGLLTFARKITKAYSVIHSLIRGRNDFIPIPFDRIYDWDSLPITKKTLLFSTTFFEKDITDEESILLSERREVSSFFEEENSSIVKVREWLFPESGDDFPGMIGALLDIILAIIRQDSIFVRYKSGF